MFLCVCCVACKTLAVIRTWWLLIVTNSWLKVAEAAGFPDAMLRLNVMGPACKSCLAAEALLPLIFSSSHFVSQAFSTGTVVASVAQEALGSWALFLRHQPPWTFLFVEGNNYSLKTSSLFPCCLPGLLSVVMNVSSLQNIRGH